MIKHYVKQVSQHLLCDKRGLHSQQPLDLICTNPLCRQNPVACSVCFDERHKHHNVVSLSKFIDELSRQSRNFNKKDLLPQIQRTHKQAKSVCQQLRKNINQKLDQFEKDIDIYADYLHSQLEQRDSIHDLINLRASPNRIQQTINLSELRQSIKYILNNSKFNGEGQMSKISAPLKQNNQKIESLISKLQTVTFNCLRRVETQLNNLKQLRQTIQITRRKDHKIINNSDTPTTKLNINKHQFTDQSTKVQKRLDMSSNKKTDTLSVKPFIISQKTEQNPEEEQSGLNPHSYQPVKYLFTMKHPQIILNNNFIKSNVYGKQAHYALATPSISNSPLSKWAIKIISCRDIYCTNSLAIGICHLNDIKNKHLQSRVNDFEDGYLLSSSGDILTPGLVDKNQDMRFKTGDILELQYDSFYKLLEIKNEKGSILSLKVEDKDNDPLFICARMTFSGDQIQLINY